MTTPTTNYGWGKPIVGADLGTWGTELNVVIDAVDAQVHNNQNATAALTTSNLDLKSVPGTPTPATLTFKNSAVTAGQQTRWVWALDTTAEVGGNVGSNVGLTAYDDTGASLFTPIAVNRQTGRVSIKGVTDGSSATAGLIGEVISSNVAAGVALTSATAVNIASLSLTAGDWDVTGEIWFAAVSGAVATTAIAAISNASATVPTATTLNQGRDQINTAFQASTVEVLNVRPCRVNLAAPATYYLVAMLTFTSGTANAAGNISARRAR